MVLHDFDIFEMLWNRECELAWEVQASQVLLFFFLFLGGGGLGLMWSLSVMPPANNTQLHSTALNCTTGMSSAVNFGTTRCNDVNQEMEYLSFQMSFPLGRHRCFFPLSSRPQLQLQPQRQNDQTAKRPNARTPKPRPQLVHHPEQFDKTTTTCMPIAGSST